MQQTLSPSPFAMLCPWPLTGSPNKHGSKQNQLLLLLLRLLLLLLLRLLLLLLHVKQHLQ